jgi:hypothetical protein
VARRADARRREKTWICGATEDGSHFASPHATATVPYVDRKCEWDRVCRNRRR